VIFVAVDGLFALFGKRGIVVLARASGGLDYVSGDDFSGMKFQSPFGQAGV